MSINDRHVLRAVRDSWDAYRESYSRTNERRDMLRIAIEDALGGSCRSRCSRS